MRQLQVLTVAIALITFLSTLLINPVFAGNDSTAEDISIQASKELLISPVFADDDSTAEDVPIQASDERRP